MPKLPKSKSGGRSRTRGSNGAKNGVVRTTAVAGPTGIAVLNGDLYVVDSGNNRVLRYAKPFSVPVLMQRVRRALDG